MTIQMLLWSEDIIFRLGRYLQSVELIKYITHHMKSEKIEKEEDKKEKDEEKVK